MYWYLKALRQYADFDGRASRMEYWTFTLINSLFIATVIILDNLFNLTIGELQYGYLYFIYILALLIPSLAVAVRRLHDTGRKGANLFLVLIPVVGFIWLLIMFVSDSEKGENQYGANPKADEDDKEDSAAKSNDNIIVYIVAWMIFTKLFWEIIPHFFNLVFKEPWYPEITSLSSLYWGAIPIALAYTVKNKQKQIILFILGGLYLAYNYYDVFERMFAMILSSPY